MVTLTLNFFRTIKSLPLFYVIFECETAISLGKLKFDLQKLIYELNI